MVPRYAADQIRPSSAAFVETFSRLAPVTKTAKRMRNPLAVRTVLGLTPSQMADVLSVFSTWPKPYTRGSVWQWEKAVAGRLSMNKYGPGKFSRHAYRDLIITCVEQASEGRYTARVAMTGPHARKWKVTLLRVKGG